MLARAVAGVAILLSFAVYPRAARASACCGAGHGIAQWLAPSERAAASFSLRMTEQLGAWAVDGNFIASGEGVYQRELRAEAGWLVRVGDHVQLGISVPLMATWSGAGLGGTSSGGGPGDVGAAARIALIEGAASPWVPSAAFTLGVTLPTGRGPNDGTTPLDVGAAGARAMGAEISGAGTTGLGVAEIRPGMVFEKSWGSFQALLAASVSVRTSHRLPDGDAVRSAPRVQLLAAAGPAWPSGLSLTVGALHEREGAPREVEPGQGPRRALGRPRDRTALLAVLAHDIGARWTAVGNLQVDVPISGIGRNEGAFAALSAGLRYVWGRRD
ncbi:hypothetical protein WME90_16390 [Sorangium sp. So ce375]|uniref:hypothetical protein n=1 Tax=Sorangium sp. So ce375 TaxID=3133306 RepID=UPI003F5BE5C5